MSEEPTFIDFRKNSQEAVTDQKLRGALSNATGTFVRLREQGVELLPDWEQMREQAHRIKAHTIDKLDGYLPDLESKLQAAGAKVLWAETGAEAASIIVDIARSHGCKLAVKSKSMVSEEVRLNEALEAAGIRAVETDLGEFIAQLAGERPSHILAPIINKTRQDVGRLFQEKYDVEYTDRIDVMTQMVRGWLREEFFAADLGISGVNFAIAETGTLVVVENEGNARLSTSIPRVHIALMGIEKLLPRFADLALFLPLLIRSATGQRMSSYVSLITGPRKPEDIDGPENLYVVMLDGGRTKMLADPVLRKALYCVRCSACLNVCPVYRRVGGHAYGWVYPGPIGAVITPSLLDEQKARLLPFASTLCGACEDVCPVKIPLPAQLVHLREKVADIDPPLPVFYKGLRAWTFLLRHPRLLRIFRNALWLAQIIPGMQYLVERIPGVSRWTSIHDFPRLHGNGAP